MPAVLEGVDRRTRLSTIFLDVLASEEINLPSSVTKYPVEDGAEISDHIVRESEEIRLAGTIALADVVALESGGGAEAGSKLVDVIEALRKLHTDRALITCSTGQVVYKDYAIAGLNAVRTADADGGNWLTVRCELQKIEKVQLKTAEVPERAAAPASGRTGQTNKPAGKSGSGSGTSGQGGANQPQSRTPLHGIAGTDSSGRTFRQRIQDSISAATGAGAP